MNKTGRRIWYGIAIVLCCVILLLSVAGIAGVWILQGRLSNSVSNLIDKVIVVTQNIQATTQSFDQKLSNMQDIVNSISQASTTLSQQVGDQGLIATLLPEQQTTNLSNLSATIQDAINNIRDTLTTARSIYQTIDALPFIQLPGLNQDQIDQLGQSTSALQAGVDNVKTAITAFRAGASDQISKVSDAATQLSSRLGDVRSRIADMNTRLTNAQDSLAKLKQTLKNVLVIGSVLGSLFLLFVAYTQVEVIRLFVQRWNAPATVTVAASATPAEPSTATETKSETEAELQPPENQEQKD